LHERQALIIARIYRLAVDLRIHVEVYTIVGEPQDSSVPPKPDQAAWTKAQELNQNLRVYIERNAIYLNDENRNTAIKAASALRLIAVKFHVRTGHERRSGMGSMDPNEDSYIGAARELDAIALPLMAELHKAFQKELGVEERQLPKT